MIRGFRGSRSHMSAQKDFSMMPKVNLPRSSFRRSHSHKTAFDSAYLVPIYCDEALPGDTFNMRMSSVCRLATPIVPFMDNLHVDFFFFAVPNRLLWANWQKFMGEQDDPGDSIDFTVPTVNMHASTGATVGSVWDYMGIPTGINSLTVNALHARAYNLIWNEWFRSEDLQNSLTVSVADGPDAESVYTLQKRGKRHDYFTSCLPWPQKGTAVDLPLGTVAPIKYDSAITGNDVSTGWVVYQQDGTANTGDWHYGASASTDSGTVGASTGNLYADLANATAATINSLRTAFQAQKMMERDARGGTRYTEILFSHFGVDSPDARVQRPEFLGGGSTRMQITPIAQTSESGTTKQGTLAAVGYQAAEGIGFTKSFVEHCVIIGLVNVRADITYQQGLHKMWSRQTRDDFYWPSYAHLGEQAVLNKEIYCDGTANDDLVFGYQERWAELRYKASQISGILRSQAASSLDYWHLAQEFASLPTLNSTFIQDAPPVSRVVAVPSEPEIIGDFYFDLVTTRCMPTYSVPGLIDHF